MSARLTALTKRVTALAGAVALTAAALLAGAGAAAAAPAGPGNIDFDATGSITVHKHEQPSPQGEVGDGSDQGVLDNPIAGVEFTVQKLDIDLSKPEAWEGIENIDPNNPGETAGDPVTKTTDDEGIAEFGDLAVGAYLVTEGEGPAQIVGKAAPFVVVIPTSVDGNWNYNVHAYPKNSVSKLEKALDLEADAAAQGQGDTVNWKITSSAPTLADNDALAKYEINDELDARLGFVGVANVMYDGEALAEGDYVVTAPEANENGNVTVALTEAGLAKVKANSGKQLTFDFNTVVIADIEDGVIPNAASQNTTVNGNDATITADEAYTYWGYVNVVKQDKANQAKLAGAEFQVFATQADAENGENPITINGEDTFVTGEDGTLKIGALNAGAEQSRDYFIKEAKAPAGYVLDETAMKVTVMPGQNADMVTTVDNVKHDGPDLPLTGATGTMLFVAAGAALVAVAVGFAARQRRARA